MSDPFRLSRRYVLSAVAGLGAFGLSGCRWLCRRDPLRPTESDAYVVDVHCHVFDVRDLPHQGFLLHTMGTEVGVIAGRAITTVLELIVLGSMGFTPGYAAEARRLDALLAAAEPGSEPTVGAEEPTTSEREQVREQVRRELARELQARVPEQEVDLEGLPIEKLLEKTADLDPGMREFIQRADETVEIESVAARNVARRGSFFGRIDSAVNFLRVLGADRRHVLRSLVNDNEKVGVFVPALVDFARWCGPFKEIVTQPSEPEVTPAQQVLLGERLHRVSGRRKDAGLRPVAVHGYAAFCPRREAEDLPDEYPVDPVHSANAGAIELGHLERLQRPALTPPPALVEADWARRRAPEWDGADVRGGLLTARYAVERGGFLGVKLYPPTGFKPLGNASLPHLQADRLGERIDGALNRLYAWCEAEQVPILVHVGQTNSFHKDFRNFSQPLNWLPVLKLYPRLRLDLGHIGHEEGDPGDPAHQWARNTASLMKDFDNVYGDLGNATVSGPADSYAKLLGDLLANPDLSVFKRRLMYGSDWFMNNLISDRKAFFDQLVAGLGDLFAAHPGFQQDFCGRNALRFLGFIDEQGNPTASPSARRLSAFYGTMPGAPRPPWLVAM